MISNNDCVQTNHVRCNPWMLCVFAGCQSAKYRCFVNCDDSSSGRSFKTIFHEVESSGRILEFKMKALRHVAMSLIFIISLCFTLVSDADMVDIQVYKGELRIIIPDKQTRNTMVIRYRSKTREVIRIAIDGLTLTNTGTNELINLPDQSASLENRIDHAGYWNTDISYSDLNLGRDEYRLTGRLTLYLIGSQRTSNFSAYLQPREGGRPADSSIDWGLSD